MSLPTFLQNLLSTGRVRVGMTAAAAEEELREADAVLARFEPEYRRDLPGEPPPLHAPAARWAAVKLCDACRFVVFRDLGEEQMERLAATPSFVGEPASIHYSVDLTFRYLPDVIRQTRAAAEEDPLVQHLLAQAQRWPLSSVGVAGVEKVRIDEFVGHACLLRMYVDRILARRDNARMEDPRVREAVKEAVGMFRELAPAIEWERLNSGG
jgi:hypothetical protein